MPRRNSPLFVALMMGAQRSSETSVLARATRRNILEDGIACNYIVPFISRDFSMTLFISSAKKKNYLSVLSTLTEMAGTLYRNPVMQFLM
jgi:hypothetical protein